MKPKNKSRKTAGASRPVTELHPSIVATIKAAEELHKAKALLSGDARLAKEASRRIHAAIRESSEHDAAAVRGLLAETLIKLNAFWNADESVKRVMNAQCALVEASWAAAVATATGGEK